MTSRPARRGSFLVLQESRPGDKDWTAFCEWLRSFLYVDRLSGLIRYRPRNAGHFAWLPDPERAAREWNAGNLTRGVTVHRGKRFGSFVRVDGCAVRWRSVREALGVHRDPDANLDQPDPRDMTDAEIVAAWGLDYALNRHRLRAETAAEAQALADAAVAKLAETMGRRLTRHEQAIARGTKPKG